MKKYLLLAIPAIIFLSLFIVSCSKDETAPQPTNTELLVAGSWKLTAATSGGADAMAFIQDCQKDNTISFVANGTGTVAESGLKCDAADPDSYAFAWSFVSGETVLDISIPLIINGSNTATINKLTEQQLVVTIFYTPPIGPSRDIRLTFQH